MLEILWLVPVLPFAGFLVLALAGRRLSRKAVSAIGAGSVGLAALAALIAAAGFLGSPPAQGRFIQTLWQWVDAGSFSASFGLCLDALSLVMMLVVTGVGFLIHVYSTEYMAEDPDYCRFFASMNLFVCSMLFLVLGDNLLLLYLGWEGVGLCSFLLIGFWYKEPANGLAARKAFIVTRVGDTAMALGLFLLFWNLKSLDIQTLLREAKAQWPVGSSLATATALLLLGGAVGKSAQLPLQTWLPDAMAGPTPVSALIHAATMVTAGVYLIARTNVIWTLSPDAMLAVSLVGAATLLVSGTSALVQTDIKRVLAYSTISQLGYMFLALGVGAWSAAMFHFMTHAFFKALLFLGAGAVILSLHHEQDIFKMGGLRKRLPAVFWTFLMGSAALASLPFVTSGFYSKDLILWKVFSSGPLGPWLWAAALAGAFLTSLYTFRLVFIVFFGPEKGHLTGQPGPWITVPLSILAVLSLIGGFVELPPFLGHVRLFSGLLETAVPAGAEGGEGHLALELATGAAAMAASLGGVAAAWLLFLKKPALAAAIGQRSGGLRDFLLAGWRFDALYDRLLIRPFLWIARSNKGDCVDLVYTGTSRVLAGASGALSRTQTGRIRWYALGIVAGAAVILAIVVFL